MWSLSLTRIFFDLQQLVKWKWYALMWDCFKENSLQWESFSMFLNWNFLQCGAEWWQMVDTANFFRCTRKRKTILLFSPAHCIVISSTVLHMSACFTIKLIPDIFTKIQLEGWLAEEQKCQSNSHLRLSSTSHRFSSRDLLPLTGLPLLIFYLS